MTRLTDLRVIVNDYTLLNQLSAIGAKALPINSLEIIYECDITGNSILELHKMFNLEILTTFQLHSLVMFRYPDNIADDIRELLSKLTNTSLDLLKPNSLHSIYLKFFRRSFEVFFSQNILEGQEGSLERICFSVGSNFYNSFVSSNDGIGEMDTFSKLIKASELSHYLKQVGDMVRGGRRFRKLNQVMYNERCYLIEREMSLIPCKIFESNLMESDFVRHCLYP
ncbi:hypothetical protein JA1_003635 [Spathaspora sp. JA1]|nr:hypothetical protein JA1_003635 [Spathaspora sp. JA1]